MWAGGTKGADRSAAQQTRRQKKFWNSIIALFAWTGFRTCSHWNLTPYQTTDWYVKVGAMKNTAGLMQLFHFGLSIIIWFQFSLNLVSVNSGFRRGDIDRLKKSVLFFHILFSAAIAVTPVCRRALIAEDPRLEPRKR